MKKVFFDTWGWVAIAHKNDNHHKEVLSFYEDFLYRKGIPVTTDYVFSETITLLRARTDTKGVDVFLDTLLETIKSGKILFHRIDDKRWQKTWNLCKRYRDKPYISFIDFSSVVVMKELYISEILTNDKHFENIGLDLKKLF